MVSDRDQRPGRRREPAAACLEQRLGDEGEGGGHPDRGEQGEQDAGRPPNRDRRAVFGRERVHGGSPDAEDGFCV